MKTSVLRWLSAALLLAASVTAPASQVRIPVTTATSPLAVTLCVQGTCDTQTRNLQGFLLLALDENGNPIQVALRNFDLQADGDYNLHLDYGLLGDIFANARNLRIYHALPGAANPFVPLVASQCAFPNVPFRTSGTADYDASGLICPVIQGLGVPCSTNIDLSTLGVNTLDSLTGTVQVVNGIIQVRLNIDFDVPLDPANPALGTLSGHGVINATAPVSLALVPPGSDWRYLDNGTDQGAAWQLQTPFFDDSAWPFGPARLGYGEGSEATVVNFGPDPANKFITTYFRHTFRVPDSFLYTNLAMRLLRDDGVVVYLNNTEIHRDNLPAGDIDYLTLAPTAVGGVEENLFLIAPPIDPSLLLSGLNTICVEVHQSAASSSDLSFDLELIGNSLFTNTPPTIVITTPTNGASTAPGTITLAATAGDNDGFVTMVEFFEGANRLSVDTSAPYTFNWTGVCPGTYGLTARATDNQGSVGVAVPVVLNVVGPAVSLISTGATWRYLDTGVDQGTAWRAVAFNDAAWAAGPAQLGFGDGDERTVINGGPATNRFLTTYFRRAFSLATAQGVGSLTLSLLRDDGAVVYLNGTEVHRNNLPAGTITFASLASSNAAAADETTNYYTASVSPALLVAGNNVIAVEVHQAANNSSDLSFDFALAARSTNLPPAVTLSSPPNNATYAVGATLTLQAAATDSDGAVARLEFYSGTNRLGQIAGVFGTLLWPNVPAGYHVLTARAYDNCGASRDSAPVAARVGAFSMIATGSVWKYLDNGSDQGAGWRARAFNDAAWASGPGELGYGDGGEATVINGGPATNRFITTYFRRAVSVPNPAVVTGLVIRLLRDDGAAVYLNGTELFRSNLPAGPLTHLTPALAAVGGADETTYFISTTDADLLVPGLNVLAVEVHQNAVNSSDVSFDLELLGLVTSFPPRLEITTSGAQPTLRWPSAAAGFLLQSSDDLASPANWRPYPFGGAPPPTDDGTTKTYQVPNTPAHRFFRLSDR